MREIFSGKRCRENKSTHCVFDNYFSNIVPILDDGEKYSRAVEAIDDNMAHAHCNLDT